jgi:hypothetical protein
MHYCILLRLRVPLPAKMIVSQSYYFLLAFSCLEAAAAFWVAFFVALEWVPGSGLQLPLVPDSLPGVGSNPGQQLLLDFLAAFLAVFLADFFAGDFLAVVMIVGGCSWGERCFGASV